MVRQTKTAYLTKIAMLSVLAYVIEFLEFALPIFPNFLKMDFSDLVALITALAMGPVAGMLVELVKNLLHAFTVGTTGGVGDLANFIVGSAFCMTAGLYYGRHRTKNGAKISLLLAIAAMVVSGAVVNYFITIPLYSIVLGLSTETIVGWSSAVIPAIHDKFTLILYAFCPFNLLKGIALTLITMPLYKHVSPLLKLEKLPKRCK